MPFVLLAQDAAPPAQHGAITLWELWRDWVAARWGVGDVAAGFLFAGVLILFTVLVERVSMAVIRRFASRTETRVDDVFVAGIPGIVRWACALLGLQVAAQVLIPEQHRSLASVALKAVSVVAIGILATRLLLRVTDAWAEQRPQMRPLTPGVKLAIKVLVIPILLVTLLQTLGVEIHAFLTALGVGALAVGLALQDVLKNIFAGIQLVLDQPVRAGDYIQLGNGTKGTVLEMGLRSTKLRTVENNVVIIPNATLASEIITNTDLADRAYNHFVTVGVAYGTDTRRAQAALLDTTRAFADTVEGAVKDSADVTLLRFGDSSVDFRVSVRLVKFDGMAPLASELLHRIHERLSAEKIEIPFPTRTVHLHGDLQAPRQVQRGSP
ncbi:MAG: hypothetical protein HMLKMBBP_01808 [Planctomycetes bacterium]|nr:hypothetical protein [Planctomycetota bacterium]